MKIVGIAAVDDNWGIGKDNSLLFSIKEDMNFFKTITKGKTVIMGHSTFLSLPNQRPLIGRDNIVLSTNSTILGCKNFHSFVDLLNYIRNNDIEVYVIGGSKIYNLFLPFMDEIFITKVYTKKEADVFFPNLDILSYNRQALSDVIHTDIYDIQFFKYTARKELNIENKDN